MKKYTNQFETMSILYSLQCRSVQVRDLFIYTYFVFYLDSFCEIEIIFVSLFCISILLLWRVEFTF